MRGRTVRTPNRRRMILEALRQGHGLHSAAAACEMAYRTLALWRAEDPEFRAESDDAADVAGDVMEHALYQRGLAGNDLAAFGWLRAHRPELYHRKQVVAVEPVVVVDDDGDANEVVRFYLPDNGRAEPLGTEAPSVIEMTSEDTPMRPALTVVDAVIESEPEEPDSEDREPDAVGPVEEWPQQIRLKRRC